MALGCRWFGDVGGFGMKVPGFLDLSSVEKLESQ